MEFFFIVLSGIFSIHAEYGNDDVENEWKYRVSSEIKTRMIKRRRMENTRKNSFLSYFYRRDFHNVEGRGMRVLIWGA